MKRFIYYALCVFTLWANGEAKGQEPNRIAQQLQAKKHQRSQAIIPSYQVFDEIREQQALSARSASLVEKSTLVNLKKGMSTRIQRLEPELMELEIPYNEQALTLELFHSSPHRDDFIVRTSDGLVYHSSGTHYRGILKGDVQSVATVSVFDDEIIGIVSSSLHGNIVIGKWSDLEGTHVVYSDRDLLIKNDYDCQVREVPDGPNPQQEAVEKDHSRSAAECVSIYFEIDYALFENKGSVGAVENYVSGIFNNVSTLYSNENINVDISEIFIWVSPDPYPTNSSSAAMDEFMSQRPNFNGTLGHLMVIGGQNTGGIAYLNVLCSSSYNYGYSDISTGYSNFPTYSWTVNVVTHETGHNMGSPHTHACSWGPQGNEALDDCYTTEGSCGAGPHPGNGGTIMSYCHLSSTGINFNNGFGSQPGDLVRARVAAASCLQQCGSGGGGGGGSCNLTITNVIEDNASCSSNNGKLTIQISGSSGSVTYDIGNGPQSSNVFNNVAPGGYTIIVKNGSSCVRETSANIIMESESPSLGATVTNATCGQPDGLIELDADGGDSPYTYKVGNQTQSSPFFQEMPSGNYTARVTDQNGCTESKQVSVFDSEGPSLSTDISHTTCGENNGTVDLSAAGGATPYIYKLDNQTSSNGLFQDLDPGTYSVEVVDNNGCVDDQDLTVQSSSAITADAEVDHTTCGQPNGEITVEAAGGTGTLRYSIGASFQTDASFTEVDAGSYTVRVKDGVNCEVVLSKAVNSSESFTTEADVQHTTCQDENGMIEVVVAGSTGPYEFQLGNGTFGNVNQFEDLSPASYQLSVRDMDGCIVTAVAVVDPSTLPTPVLNVDRTHCGLHNGSIDVQTNGGIGPFSYNIGEGFVDSSRFEDLLPATYQIVVQDAMGCLD
ncbi:MAG: zinc-dependent metalloprotease, partial [Saprospiraceae bacterium]|nr:zinc-dependent metalloprotease [Saprospiraceae bacterium]